MVRSEKINLEGLRRTKKDTVLRLIKLRQTGKAAFAASSFSSWLFIVSVKIGRKMREHLINYECVLPLQSYHPPHTKYFITSNHNSKERL